MSKKKKTNPRRIPVSKATLRKEVEATKGESVNRTLAIFLTVLCDKFGYGEEELKAVQDGVRNLADSVVRGYVNVDDLMEVLWTEYKIDIHT